MHNIFWPLYGPNYDFRYIHVNQIQLKFKIEFLPGHTKNIYWPTESMHQKCQKKMLSKTCSTSWDLFIVTQGLTCQPAASKKHIFPIRSASFSPGQCVHWYAPVSLLRNHFWQHSKINVFLKIEIYFSVLLEWCKKDRLNKWLVVPTCEALH